MNPSNSDKKNWLRGLAITDTQGAEVGLLARPPAKVGIATSDGQALAIIRHLWEVPVVPVITRDRRGGEEVAEVIIM
jgi:hypothetical protein